MSLLLRIASDLHLEAFQTPNYQKLVDDFLSPHENDSEAILVLAGDISSKPHQLIEFIKLCQKQFKGVIFVPGNHEYYHNNYDELNEHLRSALQQLNDADGASPLYFAVGEVKTYVIDGVRFVLGTMWADGGPTPESTAQVGYFMNDFRIIHRTDGDVARRFTVEDMVIEHKAQKAQIKQVLEQPFDGKTVVITHHLPSRRLVSQRFWPGDGSDGANGGFVGDCDNIICTLEPNLWVHGHTHDTIDTMLWKTHIICNPAGYRGEWQSKFNSYMVSNGERAVVMPRFVNV